MGEIVEGLRICGTAVTERLAGRTNVWVFTGVCGRLCEIGEPGVDDGSLSDFFELNSHADVEFTVDDAADGVELAILMRDVDFENGAGGQRVEHVEVAALAAKVASAGLEACFGAGFDDLR